MGAQRRLQAGPPDPGAAAAVAQQMPPAVRPPPAGQVGADGDQAGPGGHHRPGPRTEGAHVRGHGVGGQRDPPCAQLPGQRARQFGAQRVAQRGQPGGPDDYGLQPGHRGLLGQRPDHGQQLTHQVPGVDAARTRAHGFRRVTPTARARSVAADAADDDAQPRTAGVDGQEAGAAHGRRQSTG